MAYPTEEAPVEHRRKRERTPHGGERWGAGVEEEEKVKVEEGEEDEGLKVAMERSKISLKRVEAEQARKEWKMEEKMRVSVD